MRRSPAQTFSFLIGAALLVVGIAGFFYCASFSTGTHIPSEEAFGFLRVNGWHNLVHVLTGIWGLAASRSWLGARSFAWAAFVLYTAIFVLGLVYGTGEAALGLIPTNNADDVLHALIAATALIAAIATPAAPPPTLATEVAAS